MRFVLVVVLLAVLLFTLSTLLRRLRMPAPRRAAALGDELVKDPVCQTYVVKSRAVRRAGSGGTHYFCSARCAARFTDD